jgi:hypothetical protein
MAKAVQGADGLSAMRTEEEPPMSTARCRVARGPPRKGQAARSPVQAGDGAAGQAEHAPSRQATVLPARRSTPRPGRRHCCRAARSPRIGRRRCEAPSTVANMLPAARLPSRKATLWGVVHWGREVGVQGAVIVPVIVGMRSVFPFFFAFAEIVGPIDSGRWFCGMSICPSL